MIIGPIVNMAGPHAALDRHRSPLRTRRIALGLTLERAAEMTGGRLSRSGWARLEAVGHGSPETWKTVAGVLGVSVEEIMPAARETDDPQVSLWQEEPRR